MAEGGTQGLCQRLQHMQADTASPSMFLHRMQLFTLPMKTLQSMMRELLQLGRTSLCECSHLCNSWLPHMQLKSHAGWQAVRNFVQLCMEGYYDGCLFHRMIPDFLIQTGDPSGAGLGGESAFGDPFKDEFHSRLKFSRRYCLG